MSGITASRLARVVKKVPAVWLLLALLIIVLLALDPPVIGMLLGCIYVLSGLFITIAGRRNRKLKRDRRVPKEKKVDPETGPSTLVEKVESEDPHDPGTGN